jgi:hypothetical protein
VAELQAVAEQAMAMLEAGDDLVARLRVALALQGLGRQEEAATRLRELAEDRGDGRAGARALATYARLQLAECLLPDDKAQAAAETRTGLAGATEVLAALRANPRASLPGWDAADTAALEAAVRLAQARVTGGAGRPQ